MIFSIADLIIVKTMTRTGFAAIAVLGAMTVVPAQEPPLATILTRAAGYVDEYQKGLRGIVAEETYLQNMTTPRNGGRINQEGRQLKSDLLLVKLGAEERWLQFRDVF